MTYIWDLDGTLIDSYDGILDSLLKVLNYFQIKKEKEDVYQFIMQKSVHELLEDISLKHNIELSLVQEKYKEYRLKTQRNVSLMDGAYHTLMELKERGNDNFIYTHKGRVTHDILKDLGIYDCFTEIITNENHFRMKPDPEGIEYILNKYNIKKEEAYYIGDRPLDILCAKNANIKGILYKKEGSPVDIDATKIIYNLEELIK